jgi:prepilin-type N-terminal cleavage/methylation domain-containing protein
MLMKRLRRGDSGFTLVELLIVIVIMGVITIPLANLVIAYFVNTATTTGRLSESHDAQIAAAYFGQDVANVGTRNGTQTLTPSVWQSPFPAGACGSSASSANQVALLTWDDISWSGTAQNVTVDSAAYIIVSTSQETQLHRIFCSGPTQVSQTQQSDVIVTHNVDTGVGIQLTCSTPCSSAAVINLTLGIKERSGKGQPLSVTLTGQRRQSP